MEYFDLFDKQGKKLDKLMQRGTSNLPGEYHKVVHIWIENSNGEYLVQQRNKTTDKYPFQWAPTAGAVTTGEEPITAAVRETFEEIGVVLLETELNHLDSLYIDHPNGNFIIEMYLVKKDISLEGLTLDFNEVKAVQYMTTEEIIDRVEKNTFWNFYSFKPNYDYFSILEKS